MISPKNILTISKYESKVLWRNWFFRIVALAGVFFTVIFNIGVFSEADTPRWFVLSNGWIMPYAIMILICVPQAAAVIFLGTGLIKKDKKLDTNEVFFVRPISNLDYVMGKALALFQMFMLINLVLMGITLIFNLTSPFLTFNPIAFLAYPLLTSVPTIVFTMGVSFFLVTVIKNQPVSIVILLGLGGVQTIYFFDQFSNILDFSGLRFSLVASELIGFVDLEFVLLQRSFYLISGIGFLFLTAFALDRLASNRFANYLNGVVGIIVLTVSAFVMMDLWQIRASFSASREKYVSINDQWADQPNIDILSNHLELEQHDFTIGVISKMVVKNNSNSTLDKIYFTLNPGLEVQQITINDNRVTWTREEHIISLTEGVDMAPYQQSNIHIQYAGPITDLVAHLEVDQKRYESPNEYFMNSLRKKYSFLQPEYVLLTKDVLWYPDTHIEYSRIHAAKQPQQFIQFSLDVITQSGKTAISQGDVNQVENKFEFRPEYPLPQLSLTIGNFKKAEIEVDSVSYIVYRHPKNDYLDNQLDEIADTLSYLIQDLKNEYEDAQSLNYPFKRLNFVEVPLHYAAYNKIYETHQSFLQPETVYWPEEGGEIREFDIRRRMRDMTRQARERNQVLTDKEKQANVFNDLVKKVFTKQIGQFWFFDGRNDDDPDYSLFPNLYTFNSGVVSQEWLLLNQSIATYLQNEQKGQNDFSRNLNGISFTEECNNLMRESSITEILTSETDFNKIQKSLSLKGKYLFSYLGQLVGEASLKSFMQDWVENHKHQLSGYTDFRTEFLSRFNMDIDPVIQKVFFETSQPAFEILSLEKYDILDGDRKRYQVLLNIANAGDNDGVVEITFNSTDNSDDNSFFRRNVIDESPEENPGELFVIKSGQSKSLGFVLDEKPNRVSINTIISENIPSVINLSMGDFSTRTGQSLFEGERILDEIPDPGHYELIVDNEDPEFSSFSPVEPTYLRAYLDSRSEEDKKYYGNWFRSYSKWLATTGSDFYGDVIRSAHFTRSGKGEKTCTWSPKLQEEGFYDIYVYMMGKNQNQFQGNSRENRQYSYHYIINHGDGQDNINFNISNAEPGWNYLGSYYFDSENASIVLTDECDLRTVYADAIKWVKL